MTAPLVVALGGNALAVGSGPAGSGDQLRSLDVAVEAVAPLAQGRDLVITHGNGPQVGALARQAEATGSGSPLDVLDAESEGLIGYALVVALDNAMADREVVALLTRTRVDPDDPAFQRPSKPIGRRDRAGRRRLVASPEPVEIEEAASVERLVAAGVVVVCVGGGGIPVARDDSGSLRGVEAVVDKDLASGLLATGWERKRCSCSPTSTGSTSTGARVRPAASSRPRRPCCGRVSSSRVRWPRRSRRLPASSSRAVGEQPSGR